MVLGRQLEVGERDRDGRGDAEEDREDDEEDAVERVVLAPPQRREDVVQLHGDGAARGRGEMQTCRV